MNEFQCFLFHLSGGKTLAIFPGAPPEVCLVFNFQTENQICVPVGRASPYSFPIGGGGEVKEINLNLYKSLHPRIINYLFPEGGTKLGNFISYKITPDNPIHSSKLITPDLTEVLINTLPAMFN